MAMPDDERQYPEPKERELTAQEKDRIRERLLQGGQDIYEIARDVGCSASQVAGIKAHLKQ